MTKNEYIASIMLEAAELLKEDVVNKKDIDTAGRRNSYNIARQCISKIQNTVTESHIRMDGTHSFNSFVKLSTLNKVVIAEISCSDKNESRMIRNIIYDSSEKMPKGYYLKTTNHNFRNKIDITIYLIAEK